MGFGKNNGAPIGVFQIYDLVEHTISAPPQPLPQGLAAPRPHLV